MAFGSHARTVVNAITLATPLGLLLGRLTGCRLHRGPRGLWYAVGYRAGKPRAAAFTIGSVIFLRHEQSLARAQLLEHEERHATQWAWCLGVVGFPLLYGLATAWSLLAAGDRASHNVFERWAGLESGGYRRPGR